MATINLETQVQTTTIYIILLLFISLLYVIINNKYWVKCPKFLRSYVSLWLMIAITSLLSSMSYPLQAKYLYGAFFLPISLSLFMYTYVRKNKTDKLVIYTFVVMFFVLLSDYITTLVYANALSTKDIVTNTSYFLIFTLPFILLLENRNLKLFFFFIIIAASLASIKRGGIIAVAISLVMYLYLDKTMDNNKKRKTSFVTFFFLVLLCYVVYNTFLSGNDNVVISRFDSVLEDGGSGRLDIWLEVINLLGSSNILEIMLGHGWDAVVRDTFFHLSSHNDALEVGYNFGVVTLIMYISFHVVYVKYIIKLVKKESKYAIPLAISYILFFISSTIAHVLVYFHYIVIFSVFWGLIFGLIGLNNDRVTAISSPYRDKYIDINKRVG